MKITMSEALRLKNEISLCVNTLNHKTNYSSLGITKENGEEVSSGKEDKFITIIKNLELSLKYSEEINNEISNFNKANGVDAKVRSMQNSKLLVNVYANAIPRSKATKSVRFETVGNARQTISVEFIPDISSTSIKGHLSAEKEKIRILQKEIEELNQQKIVLSFEYFDIESLMVD